MMDHEIHKNIVPRKFGAIRYWVIQKWVAVFEAPPMPQPPGYVTTVTNHSLETKYPLSLLIKHN